MEQTTNNDIMAKRFISTDLFNEDWLLDCDIEVRLYFVYAFLNCDHAGILRANIRPFNALNGTNLTQDTILSQINADKQRIRKLTESKWYLTDFVEFQYGPVLNPANRAHQSVIDILTENGIMEGANKGLGRGLVGVKDKDKDKDKEYAEVFAGAGAENPNEIPDLKAITDQFASALSVIGLPPEAMNIQELALKFESYYASQGWRKQSGVFIYKWRPLVTQWVMKEKGNIKTPTKQIKRSWD